MQLPIPTLYNLTTRLYEYQRTPTWISSIDVSNTAYNVVHTPIAGTTSRVLGWSISWGNDVTCASPTELWLRDSSASPPWTVIGIRVGPTTTGGNYVCNFPGNGFLASNVNQTIVSKLSFILTGGAFLVTVWGVDEY